MLKLRTFVSVCFFALVIPLLSIVFILFQYTVQQSLDKYETQLRNMAAAIVSSVEDQIQVSHENLHRASQSMDFLYLSYAQRKNRLYIYASELDKELSNSFSSIPLQKGFFFFNSYTQYIYPDYNGVLPPDLLEQIRELLEGQSDTMRIDYCLFTHEEKVLLLLVSRHQYGSMGVLLDPARDPTYLANQNAMPETLYFGDNLSNVPTGFQVVDIGDNGLSLLYELPQGGFLEQMDSFQLFLLVSIVVLVLLLPVICLLFYIKFYRPLQSIVSAFSIVSEGNLSYRLTGTNLIKELNLYYSGFNKMMDTLQEERANSLQWQQKSYNQQLDTMQAQLQFLQLQIRPHFYLNCLKNIYSLLDLKKYGEAEDLILSLSAYLSHIFRNIQSHITLREELDITEKYVRLCQHLGRTIHLSLCLDNDSLSCKILPMSILTFVENSIKHGNADKCLEIFISVSTGDWEGNPILRITVKNNGGIFNKEVLQNLNTAVPSTIEYRQEHIGISNVRYRLWLMYREKANLIFRNEEDCAVVEVLMPY